MGLSRKKKAEYRHDALFIATFGFPPAGFHLDYAATVGLSMNLDRLLYRDAAKSLLGTSAATSNASLSRIWFDALADVEARIDSLMWEVNSRRAEARALARRRK